MGRVRVTSASHSRFFWGLRLHLVCTVDGLPVGWALTGAKADERETLLAVLATMDQPAQDGQVVIADKNYYGAAFEAELAKGGITLIRPRRMGERPRSGQWFLRPLRQIIESVFDTLVERVRGRSVLVPLLADRDISGAGIEVDFAGHRALVAAGPAALAHRLSRPLYAACVSYADEDAPVASVRVELAGPITAAPGGGANEVEVLTQAWVDAFTGMLADKPEDWHMMQKVYTEDLDPERLARARAVHRSRGAGQ